MELRQHHVSALRRMHATCAARPLQVDLGEAVAEKGERLMREFQRKVSAVGPKPRGCDWACDEANLVLNNTQSTLLRSDVPKRPPRPRGGCTSRRSVNARSLF